jgi:PAS domain S-box-containing protein
MGDITTFFRAIAVAVCFMFVGATESDAVDQADVLVLHSYGPHNAWNRELSDGLCRTFGEAGDPPRVYVENMNAKRLDVVDWEAEFASLLVAKYADVGLDAVVATDDAALGFCLRRLDSLFPGTPLVFCGVSNRFSADRLAERTDTTGVLERVDIAANLELIDRLHPQARTVALMIGHEMTARAVHEEFMEVAPRFADRFAFRPLTGIGFEEMRAELAALPQDSVILYLSFVRDAHGVSASLERIGSLVAAAPVPAYTLWSVDVGNGFTGGMTLSGEKQGALAAEMTLAILAGASPEAIPMIERTHPTPVFDFRLLERFGIDADALPADARIINRPDSWLHRYKTTLLVSAGIMVVLLGVIVALSINILRRREAEARLLESERRYKTLFFNSAYPIALYDPHGVVLMANPVLAAYLATTPDEMAGHSLSAFSPELHAAILPRVQEVSQTGSTIKIEHSVPIGGRQRWFSSVYSPATRGDERDVLVISYDITERKQAEEAMARAKEAATAASRSKSEFLANMSHELRTPLNGVLGMLQLAETTDLTPEQREYLDMAAESGESLLTLLSDVLDLSRIEAGGMELREEAFSLRKVLETTAHTLHGAAAHKGVDLTVEADPALTRLHLGDAGRIRQVLLNLAGNAVKFTDEGEVRLAATLLPSPQAGAQRVLLTVTDEGVGIPDDKLDLIFTPFAQGESDYARRYQGAGLGLSIVRRLTLLMGGGLCIESELGHGTTVALRLDLPPAQDDEQTAEPGADSSTGPLSVLVVEDERINLFTIERFLDKLGHKHESASGGREALAMLARTRYDVVLMDIQMPDMDGMETTRRIRSGAALDPSVPIVAITAHAMKGDRESFLAGGMDGYVPKPIRLDALDHALAEAVSRRG